MNLYGFAGGDPVNYSDPFGLSPDTLTSSEKEKLGDKCKEADCSQIQVYRGKDGAAANALRKVVTATGRSVTHGHNIFLADDDVDDFAILEHEVQHVTQYEKWGAAQYYRRGISEQFSDLTGGHPYAYRLNGRRLGAYGMEQQGQIVEDCSRGKVAACWAAARR